MCSRLRFDILVGSSKTEKNKSDSELSICTSILFRSLLQYCNVDGTIHPVIASREHHRDGRHFEQSTHISAKVRELFGASY